MKAEVQGILCMMIELSASDENYFCWASPTTSLGRAWPALTLFTSHLEMKHHHVFIIKHSHSHIATHEDVSRPRARIKLPANLADITMNQPVIIRRKTQDLSRFVLLMSGTKYDLWFLNYILIYILSHWLGASSHQAAPSIIFAIVSWHLMRHILWGIISRSTTK